MKTPEQNFQDTYFAEKLLMALSQPRTILIPFLKFDKFEFVILVNYNLIETSSKRGCS